MTFLARFTNTNPRARLNFSWERSARRLLEIARHQYKDAYDEAELPPRGQFAEQALVALLIKDPAFKKLSDSIKEGHAWFDEIEATLNEDENTEKKTEKVEKAGKALSIDETHNTGCGPDADCSLADCSINPSSAHNADAHQTVLAEQLGRWKIRKKLVKADGRGYCEVCRAPHSG